MKENKRRVAVIGAGNGGHAIAGHLSLAGHIVSLFDRNLEKLDAILAQGGIYLQGQVNGFGKLHLVTDNISKAINGFDIIMIATTANAHGELARNLAKYLVDDQIIILNPGRTCGAIEFRKVLIDNGCTKRVYVAEAQTLVYACRIIERGLVNIIGVKEKVMVSALPSSDTPYVIDNIRDLYPCFIPARNVLVTSLENIGAIFHPCVILFNAAAIERGNKFYFYRDITDHVAKFIEQFDNERLAVGKAYGIDLISAKEWVSYAYTGVEGVSLMEKMKNNPAYYEILAPTSIESRQLLEDIPTGIVPILHLGEMAGVKMPLFRSIVSICSALLNRDFFDEGRSLEKFGLKSMDDVLSIIS